LTHLAFEELALVNLGFNSENCKTDKTKARKGKERKKKEI